MNIFWGYEDFVDIFRGHHRGYIFRGHFYAFWGLFSGSMYGMGDFVGGVAKIPNILWGA